MVSNCWSLVISLSQLWIDRWANMLQGIWGSCGLLVDLCSLITWKRPIKQVLLLIMP